VTSGRSPGRGPRRGRRWSFAFGIGALLLLAAGLPLAAPIAHAAAAGRSVEYASVHPALPPTTARFFVNLTDTPAFSPATLSNVAVGENVSVHLNNTGAFNHTFTVSKLPNVAINRSISPDLLYRWFAQNGSLANVSLAPGHSAWANFSVPGNSTGGSYEIVSLVPYQFQAGMIGSLVVTGGHPAAVLSEEAVASPLSFLPNTLVVNATSFPLNVEVELTDVGALPHTWTLSAFPNLILNTGNFTSFFSSHAPLANIVVASAGQVANATFTVGGKGIYEYICQEPGHFAGGMYGFLYVGIPPPAVAAPLSSSIVQEGVLAGAAVLLAIAVVIALASNYLGRFPPPPPGAGHH
jgi:uncharacterized cupredoxin-like copper-binding protein